MATSCYKVKLIVSYGGTIRRCSISDKARYFGGENRLVKISLSERLDGLRARLVVLAGYSAVRIRYAIVEEGLDVLHDVDSDADLWKLMTLLYYRAAGVAVKEYRVRAFLFPSIVDATDMLQSLQAPPPACVLQHSASSPALLPEVDVGGHEDVFASLMRTQSDADVYMTDSCLTRADSGFEALAAIAEEQKNPTSSTTSQQVDSGLEAVAAVAAEQKLRAAPAPVVFIPVVPVVTVYYFYPVIPVHPCLVINGVQTVAIRG